MSSIWTPGGEHRVPPRGESDPPTASGPAPGTGAPPGTQPGGGHEPELSPEEQARLAEAAREVAEVRAQLAAAPPAQVVANHVIGLYELAAIHLSQNPPGLDAARLAIDALGAVLDACHGRLGDFEATLTGARSQIQLAFVAARQGPAGGGGSGAGNGGHRPDG